MRVPRGPRALLAAVAALSALSALGVSSALSALNAPSTPSTPSALSALKAESTLSALNLPSTLNSRSTLSALSLPSTPRGLSALNSPSTPSALSAPSDADPLYAKPGNYCAALKEALDADRAGRRAARAPVAPLWLLGGGAARAVHALLAVTLRLGLGLPADAVLLREDAPADLCPLLNYSSRLFKEWNRSRSAKAFPLSVAAAWRGEPCAVAEGRDFFMGLGGAYYSVHGGAAPVARRLLARRAPAAAADCRSWHDLRRADCRFLAPRDERLDEELPPPSSDWLNCTCSSNDTECIAVVLVAEEGAGAAEEATRLARELCERARALRPPPPPLRPAALRPAALQRALRHHGRSFLFVDYDWWQAQDAAGGERVQAAPPLPGAAPAAAVSVLAAPLKLIKKYMPRVPCVLERFRPAPATLRRLLRNERALGPDEAACEAAASARGALRHWVDCPEPPLYLYVQTCGDRRRLDDFHSAVRSVVADYWNETGTNVTLLFATDVFANATVDCDDVGGSLRVFDTMKRDWLVTLVAGAVVMGAGGAQLAPGYVPLVLADDEGQGRACAVSPDGRRLLAALRWLLGRCGWRRLAVLRDEAHAAKWQNFSSSGSLVVHEQTLSEGGEGGAAAALAALRALDARVVVLDAGAAAAARALHAAAEAGMGPARGYAWLVLRAAGEDGGADWPPPPGFQYVTLSGWWRGGPGAPGTPGGAPHLRDAATRRLPARWPPLAAPLLDALLLMMTGIEYFLANDPTFPYEHNEESRSQMLERLRHTSVAGVAQQQSCGKEPLVFVHRWSAGEPAGRLLGVWPESGGGGGGGGAWPDHGGGGLCEPGVRDAAPCHSTWSGDAYAPNCHDAAWALALAALVLAPPALCAAAAGRRARLRRRDRALERRLLPRAREASAAPPAELRALVVPRAALELLDELGAGHYGSVRLGVLRRARGPPLAVAAKAARAGAGTGAAPDAAGDLVREGALLAALRHDHVVRLAAVVLEAEGAPLLLMEHAFHGDLQRYLRARRPALERARAGEPEPEAAHVGALALTRLAREAAAALGYLALHRVVHRDVRAANCLVDARRSLRLADFGLARRLDAPADEAPGAAEYLCRRRALFPVLWMAPESLARGVFSAATDVWALGVLVLELATLGARPFGAWPAPRVLGHVRAGGSPPLPRDAAASTRGLVATCWRRAADERPSAAQLVAWLAAHPRAVRPALAPPAGGDRPPPAGGDRPPHGDDGLYLEEWTA